MSDIIMELKAAVVWMSVVQCFLNQSTVHIVSSLLDVDYGY